MNKIGTTLAICIPSGGGWEPAFGMALVRLITRLEREPLKGVGKSKVIYLSSCGSMLPQVRQILLTKALKNGADAILFLDDDMVFPANLVHELWAMKKEFAAAAGCTKEEPAKCVAYVGDGPQRERVRREQLVGASRPMKVTSVGLSSALIRVGPTLRRTRPPHFMMEWIPENGAYCGEDVYFCAKWAAAGGEIFIHPKVSLAMRHVGEKEYHL